MFKSLVTLLALSSVVLGHEFSACKNSKGDLMGVHSLSFIPDPPKSGKPVSVSVKGAPTVGIVDGELHVEVRVLGVTVGSQTLKVCDILKCPVAAGEDYEGTVTQEIPEGTPDHMGATVRLTMVNGQGQMISCLESYVQISNSGNVLGATETEDHKEIIGHKHAEFMFSKWKAQFPKTVANLKIFTENLIKVVSHNRKQGNTFTMALNEFGSMTEEEFVNSRMGIREPREGLELNGPIKPRVTLLRQEVSKADPPSTIDWTEKGIVAPVKNQGSCGSCWAFSAVGALESAYAKKYGTLVEFSEQELVSCDDNDYGCQGGLMDTAFDWIERASAGLCSETDYSYTSGMTSARGECMKESCNPVPNSVPKGYVDVPPTEASLLAAVAENGPISVAIEADQSVFQFYHSGVLTGACGTHLNHGVLLVGYGADSTSGTPYWKVKNSWGAGWGEDGFVRIQRGKRWPSGGECGINTKASYPVF